MFTPLAVSLPHGSRVTASGTISSRWRLLPADPGICGETCFCLQDQCQPPSAETCLAWICTYSVNLHPLAFPRSPGTSYRGEVHTEGDQGTRPPAITPWDAPQQEQAPCHVPWGPSVFSAECDSGCQRQREGRRSRHQGTQVGEKVEVWGRQEPSADGVPGTRAQPAVNRASVIRTKSQFNKKSCNNPLCLQLMVL